jgi:hypothetical protein
MFSFCARKQHVEIAGYLRRICDSTAPNNGLTEQLTRSENRYNRTLPVACWPWAAGKPDPNNVLLCVSKDITDHGIGLVLNQPLTSRDVVVGLRSSDAEDAESWLFLGHVVRGKPIGGGFWVVGVELVELLNRDQPEAVEHLLPHAERLLSRV